LKRAYIYPISARDKHLGQYNPYLDDFMDAMEKHLVFVNRNHPSNSGIFDFLKYIFTVKFVFLNWIENIPERKGGTLQTYFLFVMLSISKWFGIKVIWTMHNKLSHSPTKRKEKEKIFRALLKKTDLILTHASAGIEFGEQMVPGSDTKIIYFPHPVKDRRLNLESEKQFDILIWGTISPYKGIHNFLEFLKQNKLEDTYRIHIVGKISDENYAKQINNFSNKKISIENRFIEDKLLADLIRKSKIILFTYSQTSILSSGALMDSVGYGGLVIGPNVGAFGDLKKKGILETYQNFNELIAKADQILSGNESKIKADNLDQFLKDHTWDKFAEHLSNKLKIN